MKWCLEGSQQTSLNRGNSGCIGHGREKSASACLLTRLRDPIKRFSALELRDMSWNWIFQLFSRGETQSAVCESRAAITKILLKRNEMQPNKWKFSTWTIAMSFYGASSPFWARGSIPVTTVCSYINTNRRVVDFYGARLMGRKCYVIKLDFRKIGCLCVMWAYILAESLRSMMLRFSWLVTLLW